MRLLVLQREREFHAALDAKGLRWDKDRTNELFVPKKSVNELISTLRTIKGEEMYLFTEDTITEDRSYKGGKKAPPVRIIETQSRQLPGREKKDTTPTIRLKLSKAAIHELEKMEPRQFALLADFVMDLMKPPEKMKVARNLIDDLKKGEPAAVREVVKAVRRSPRLNPVQEPATEQRRSRRLQK